MAMDFMHKRYFQLHWPDGGDPEAKTFTGTAEQAYAEFNFPAVWNTNSPTKTYAFADSNKTLVVSYEFDNQTAENGFRDAVAAAYDDDSAFDENKYIAHIKTEWYTYDSIESTQTNIVTSSSWGL